MKKEFCFIVTLLLVNISWSQGEGNIWYFSSIGLDFNSSGAPVHLTDSKMQLGVSFASISDASGNLLFYTNGITVWNKNHDFMPNGVSLFGAVQHTEITSLIISHHHHNPNIYYIFSINNKNSSIRKPELRYATVDISLDNGLGDIVSKNILLNDNVAESLGGVKHANGRETWIVAHGYDNANFYAYLLTASGIKTTPVVSTVGEVIEPDPIFKRTSLDLKFSSNGEKLAFLTGSQVNSPTQLFDFDPLNACITNLRILKPLIKKSKRGALVPIKDYNAEFSPSGDFLYTIGDDSFDDSNDKNIYQYDLNAPILIDSEIEIITVPAPLRALEELQLGPDGKIYAGLSYFNFHLDGSVNTELSIINTPNNKGSASNYSSTSINLILGPSDGIGALPSFIRSDVDNRIYYEGPCLGETATFSLDDPVTSVTWNFGDPDSGIDNTSTVFNPSHHYKKVGTYTVTASTVTSGVPKKMTMNLKVYENPDLYVIPEVDLKQCDDDTDGISFFNLEEAITKIVPVHNNEVITFHESLTDAEQNLNPILNTTNYINKTPTIDTVWARVENKAHCYAVSQVNLIVSTTQIPKDFIKTIYACDDDTDGIIHFDLSSADAEIKSLFPSGQEIKISYYRNATDALSELNVIEDPTSYVNENSPFDQELYVRIDNKLNNDCLGLGKHITLEVLEGLFFELDTEATICMDENPELTIETKNAEGNYRYRWINANGEPIGSESSLTVNKGGIYNVVAINDDCETPPKQINVKEVVKITPTDDLFIIVNNSISIDTSKLGEGDFEFSLDNEFSGYQDAPSFENIANGDHKLFIRDKQYCGTSTPFEFSVFTSLRFPKFFSPNNDGQNDSWNIIGFNRQLYKDANIKIFDRYGKILKNITPFSSGWDGTFNGRALQPSDYWYTATIIDINNDALFMTGHFTLKR